MADRKPRPITDDDRRQVAELHSQSLTRNAIAREMGRSGRTVSRIAADLGLTFERAQVRAATEARKQDAKARRAQLALDLLDDAARLRAQLWKPAVVFNFGGRENVYEEHQLDQPPAADQLKLVQAATIAIGKSIDIDKHDRVDDSLNGVDAWLAAMTGQAGD